VSRQLSDHHLRRPQRGKHESIKEGEINMTNRIAHPSPLKTARIAGFLNLIFIVTFFSTRNRTRGHLAVLDPPA
jgi:hypothetical protein